MPRLSKKQHFLRNFAKHGLGKKELSSRSTPFLYEVHHDHQPEHGECQSDFDGSSDDNADPGRNTYAPRVKIISFGPELADECTDERHDEDAYKTAHEDTDEGTPAALADALRDAGVDVAVLANNHCCDNGAEGIRTSVEELDRCGIRHTGAFADSADYKKNNPLYLTYCGIRLAIVNYTYGTNGMPVPEGTVVNLIDTVRMAADLAAARASGVDFIVACVHWGDEYQRRENAAQRSLAAFLRRHGTDVVVGSHPHVIQPWVADSSHVVLYSLGNLVSGQRRRYTDGGLVATVEAVRHPEGRMTYRLETTPAWVSVPGYRILTPEAADTMTLPAAYGIFRADLDALPGNGL